MKHNERASAGFTFVELLVTVVLIAAVLPVTMRSIALCTGLAGRTRHEIEAVELARSQMTDLLVSGDSLGGDLSGDCGEDWPAYAWRASLSDWGDTDLQQLDVTVFWTARDREASVTLTTLVEPSEP